MLLSRLELRNFRSFEQLDLDLAPTTVIIGANDSGKSTILEAVTWLLERRARRDWSSAVRTGAADGGGSGIVSIVGYLTDMGESTLRMLGPMAPEGTLRLGRSPSLKNDGLHVVLDASQAAGFAEAVDNPDLRELIGAHESDPILDTLESRGVVAYLDDQAWIDFSSIWGYTEPASSLFESLSWGSFVSVVALGGPRDNVWSPAAVVEPIVREAFRRSIAAAPTSAIASRGDHHSQVAFAGLGVSLALLERTVDELTHAISQAHSRALARSSSVAEIEWETSPDPEHIVDALVTSLTGIVHRHFGFSLGSEVLDVLGPGTRRSLAIQALNLYRDPVLWPTREDQFGLPSLAVILLEEPENGLHPAAQRELAGSLRDWASFGLQMIVVTHSAAFVNAADPAGIRLARRVGSVSTDASRPCTVNLPHDLKEIQRELGVRPSDILLARRFVIVEGETEAIVLDIWAHRLGLDLRADGVQLVPMGGFGAAERVAQFMNLAYPGADFVVVLDSGGDTTKMKATLDAKQGDLVETIVLREPDLESFYHPDAVEAWLRLSGAQDVDVAAVPNSLRHTARRLRALGHLSQRYLGRRFRKVEDGRAIANLTSEAMIDEEIKRLLVRIGS